MDDEDWGLVAGREQTVCRGVACQSGEDSVHTCTI